VHVQTDVDDVSFLVSRGQHALGRPRRVSQTVNHLKKLYGREISDILVSTSLYCMTPLRTNLFLLKSVIL